MIINICDDNEHISKQLQKDIETFFKKNKWKKPIISIYNNGEALLNNTEAADIVFLDIEMPGFNGIYVGSELKKRNPNTIVIIITSFSEYLDDAMSFNVFRYLSKPIETARLFRSLKDAVTLYSSLSSKTIIDDNGMNYTVNASDIVFVETTSRHTIIHTINHDYISTHPMTYWKNKLKKNCFFQSHRCYIINFLYVTKFSHTEIHLLNDHYIAYLTRRKYSEFKSAYLLFLESRT